MGERGEKHQCVVASHVPPTGDLAPQPRHVPWLGIQLVTLWFAGQHSIHWATPARAALHYVEYHPKHTKMQYGKKGFNERVWRGLGRGRHPKSLLPLSGACHSYLWIHHSSLCCLPSHSPLCSFFNFLFSLYFHLFMLCDPLPLL